MYRVAEFLRGLFPFRLPITNGTGRFPLTKVLGELEIPAEYPSQHHLQIHDHVNAYFEANEVPESLQSQFRMAMNSIVYRYKSFVDASDQFSNLLQDWGDAPPQPQRYSQERAFFEFVMTGNACLEALAYALYALGSLRWPESFRFENDEQRRRVTISSTADAYRSALPRDDIARFLTSLLESQEFRIMSTLRRVLYHRGLPGRMIVMGTSAPSRYHDFADVEGIDISVDALEDLLSWTVDSISQAFASAIELIQSEYDLDEHAA